MPDDFQFDVFLSHRAKDKEVVRVFSLSASNGERAGVRCRNLNLLRKDGVQVWFDEWVLPVASVYDRSTGGRSQSAATVAKIEEGLEHSRVLLLCMSDHAFGSTGRRSFASSNRKNE